MVSSSKYNTGLYYKCCLYSGSPEWVPSGKDARPAEGYLKAAVAINKTHLLAEVAIYEKEESAPLLEQAKAQLDIGFKKLEVEEQERVLYNVLYQTPRKTAEVPAGKKFKDTPAIAAALRALFNKLPGRK